MDRLVSTQKWRYRLRSKRNAMPMPHVRIAPTNLLYAVTKSRPLLYVFLGLPHRLESRRDCVLRSHSRRGSAETGRSHGRLGMRHDTTLPHRFHLLRRHQHPGPKDIPIWCGIVPLLLPRRTAHVLGFRQALALFVENSMLLRERPWQLRSHSLRRISVSS
jgi:hypothetical protein